MPEPEDTESASAMLLPLGKSRRQVAINRMSGEDLAVSL